MAYICHRFMHFILFITQDGGVGPGGVPGYRQVQELAHYLVSLRKELALSATEEEEVIRLWESLHDSDKSRVTYLPRHKKRLLQGRFKVSKTHTTPGADSVRRWV